MLMTCVLCFQSLVIPEKFQHILRVLNTNIDGRRKIAFAITAIKVTSPLKHATLHVMVVHTFRACSSCVFWCTATLTSCSVSSQGVGRRYAHVVLRKADIDLNKRAGELTDEEVRRAWRVCRGFKQQKSNKGREVLVDGQIAEGKVVRLSGIVTLYEWGKREIYSGGPDYRRAVWLARLGSARGKLYSSSPHGRFSF